MNRGLFFIIMSVCFLDVKAITDRNDAGNRQQNQQPASNQRFELRALRHIDPVILEALRQRREEVNALRREARRNALLPKPGDWAGL